MSSQSNENSIPQLSCVTCGKFFANGSNLKKHIVKYHEPLPATDTTTTPTPENDQAVHVEQTEDESNGMNELDAENEMMAELVLEMNLLENIKELTQGAKEPEEEVEVKKELLEKINRFKLIVEAKNKILQQTKEDKKNLRNEVECSKQVEINTIQALNQKEKEIDVLKKELKAEKDMAISAISESKTKKKVAKDSQKEVQQLKAIIEERDKYIKSLEDMCKAPEETREEQGGRKEKESSDVQMNKDITSSFCVTCKRNFLSDRDLDNHMNAKHQSKECPICDETYANKLELVRHINMCMDRNGAAGSFVKCHKCNKNFNREGLRRHNENGGCKQGPQNPTFVCNKCNAVCINILDLRKHKKEDHDEEEKSKEVCRHWRSGNCFRGNSCKFSHVGFQSTSDLTRSGTTAASKPCRNGNSCIWLARGKCHFRHQEERGQDTRQNQSRQSNNQSRSEQICWYNENCKRNPCPFKHMSSKDFPNLSRNQNQRIPVWNNGNQ